jgi:hypothetical protein
VGGALRTQLMRAPLPPQQVQSLVIANRMVGVGVSVCHPHAMCVWRLGGLSSDELRRAAESCIWL